MLALASLSLSSFAQDATTQEKYSVATNSFWSNWFYEVGADWNSWYSAQEKGAGYSKSPFKKFRSNPGVSLAFGKWYTPGVGFRTKIQGIWGKFVDADGNDATNEGNGYSDEWVEEAAKRGLDCEKSCPKIFERYLDPASIEMFESMGVMKKNELEARNEVKWETYTKKIQIEARVMGDLSMNHIIPVATHYQSQLAKNVENMIDIFGEDEGKKLTARNINIIKKIAERTQIIETGVEELVNARKVANKIESEHDKAIAYHDTVAPKMEEIRYQIDKLELTVADELWTLPKYRELLFIR